MTICTTCGRENPGDARFCNACGQSVAAAADPAGTRKTVTILFCDVVNSTGLGDRLDAEALRAVMVRYFDIARPLVERHGGTVDKFIGDAVMGVFGVPRVHDDDALRAVRAAHDLQQALADPGGIRVRIGVATGEAITGSEQTLGSGAVFNLAARLQTAASPGEVMISDATQRLVRDAVTVEALSGLALRGISNPVQAHRLLDVAHDAPGHRRRLDAPLVGRAREQRQIGDAFEQAVDGRACHLVTLLGAAGVGKSRLAGEFLTHRARDALILRGRCLPYGDGIAYHPLSEALAELPAADGAGEDVRARIDAAIRDEPDADLIVDHLAGLAGSSRSADAATREEVIWAARRLLETLARRRPVVLLLDDLQWAESALLDLIDYIASWSRDAPIVLLCLARPELLEERPAWAGGKLNATTLLLERLAAPECETLVGQLVGSEVSRATCARVAAAAEGNPLFAEELVAMLADDGMLKLHDGVYTEVRRVGDIAVPATVQAVLAARLDRLDPHERIALECAAVEGEIFHHSAVAELSSLDDEADSLGLALGGLLRKDLVRPARSSFPGEEAFRFHHLMVRDAAYDGLPKLVRAERHEQFAGWLERHSGHAGAGDEIAASHLTRALRYLEEVGVDRQRRPDLAQRARAHLIAAGRRAMDRGDVGAATRLLSDAIVIADTATAERLPLLADLGFALLGSGALARAAEVFDDALGLAHRLGERRLEQHALLGAAFVRFQSDPSANAAAAQGTARHAIVELAHPADELGLARAWLLMSETHGLLADAGEMERALAHVVGHARRAGARALETDALAERAYALHLGPTPASRALEEIEELRIEARGAPSVEAMAATQAGPLLAMLGRAEEGRASLAAGSRAWRELGNLVAAEGHGAILTGFLELLAGSPAAADAPMRRGLEMLAALGETSVLSTVAGVLARVQLAIGRDAEALRFAETCQRAASPDDIYSQALWRSARAVVLARRGEDDAAEELARAAARLTERTDHLVIRADALADLGCVLEILGRHADADASRGAARELYERKEAHAAVTRLDASHPRLWR